MANLVGINFTVWNTRSAGGTRAIFEIADRLAKRNYKVTVTALYGNDSWFPLNRVKVKYVTRKGEYFLFSKLSDLLHDFTTFKLDPSEALVKYAPNCDINVATWYPTAFPVWFSGKGTPCYFMQDFPEQFSDKQKLEVFKTTLRLPFLFMANSNYAKDIILKYQPNAKMKVVGVGVNTDVFHLRSCKVEANGRKVVMCILYPWKFKGTDVALQVIRLVNKKIPIHAILVGSKVSLDKSAKGSDIDFPYTHFEFVSDEVLAELYSSADIFLFTSYAESFGLPPLEAMACGTTVVTTDCKGNRDYAIGEYNCLMTPAGDVGAVVTAVIKALTDDNLAEGLRRRGVETARQWTWDKVIDNIEAAFKEFVT